MKKLLLILLFLPMIGFGQLNFKLDSITMNYFDSTIWQLKNVSWSSFYYDLQGRCTTEFRFFGAPEQIDNTYDINNNLIEKYESVFDSTILTWTQYGHTIYTYDINNNLIEKEWEYWNGIQWQKEHRKLYYYDINNYRTHREHYNWDFIINQYELGNKYEYTYQSGKPISRLDLFYTFPSVWDTAGKQEFSYLGNNLSSHSDFNYNNSTNNFILEEYTDFFCNSISLTNTAIPTYDKTYFYYSLDLFQNQIDSARHHYSGTGFVTYKYHYSSFSSTSIQESRTTKELINVTDILGRETKGKANEPLFYIYDDGTVEKRIVLE